MATYTMDDGRVVKDDNAVESWTEDAQWDGSNFISKATGSQWDHERLHKSKKGNYWIESWSQGQGSTPSARWVTLQEAAAWMIAMDEKLPDDLLEYADDVSE